MPTTAGRYTQEEVDLLLGFIDQLQIEFEDNLVNYGRLPPAARSETIVNQMSYWQGCVSCLKFAADRVIRNADK